MAKARNSETGELYDLPSETDLEDGDKVNDSEGRDECGNIIFGK